MENQTFEFTVLEDHELEDAGTPPPAPEAPAKRGRGRPRKEATPEAEAEEIDVAAEDIAKLAREIAAEAASIAVTDAMGRAGREATQLLANAEEKIKALELKYVKPQNLCLHVKMGDLPAVKLKTRAAKILPKLLVQANIGRVRAGNWPMMVGPTGCGKTVAAEQLAETLKLDYSHINFSEGASETWLWGRQTPMGFVPGQFWERFTKGGVFLADEMDACNDNVLLSLNTAIGNHKASNPINGETAEMHPDFIFVAATNTNGKGGTGSYTGRTRLDGATLNRFALFAVDYDTDLEKELCPDGHVRSLFTEIRKQLVKKNSGDVVSSRDMKNAYAQLKAGFSLMEITESLKMRMDKGNHQMIDERLAAVLEKKSGKGAAKAEEEDGNGLPF